jgi:hypothetical protein
VYDGLGNPDEPYRFVEPTADARTSKKPTTAHADLAVVNGRTRAGFANSGESGPQISVYLAPGAFEVGSGVTSVSVTATPEAPSAPAPDDGAVLGNAYRITATADGHDVQARAGQVTIQMRTPKPPSRGDPRPVFEQRTSGGWTQRPTIQPGFDFFQTTDGSTGLWVLVQPADAPDSGGGINVGLLVAGVGILVVGGVIVGIRVHRTRNVAP